jgi:MoaA/NifB/PqqE/SkfB family radical SAM enzyme
MRKWMVTHVITEKCNLNCRMCFQSKLRKKQSQELPLSRIEEFYRKHQKDIMAVNITGGEPFLRSDCIELLEKLDAMGLVTTVNTNGTLITPEIADRLGSLSRLRSINVSIDGSKTIHEAIRSSRGSFDKTIHNLALLIENIRANAIQVNTMIMPETLFDLDNHITYLESKGIKKVELIFPGSYGQAELDRSADILNLCGLSEIVLDTADEEVFRQLSVESAAVVSKVIGKHPQTMITVAPKTFLKNPALFLNSELDNFNVDCSKLKRNEIRINSAGYIVFCDTLRIPLAHCEELESLGNIINKQEMINLKTAIGYGLPCCKRCCKSANLELRQLDVPYTERGCQVV